MFLAILAFLLIAGIAYYQTAQGLFSALIMTILAIVSAVVAFNYYELLAQSVFYNGFSAYADAICLMVGFKGQTRDMLRYFGAYDKCRMLYGGLVELIVNCMTDVKEGFIDFDDFH